MEADEKERLCLEYRYRRKLQAQKDRAVITNQYVRGCTLMNGGGAVALLAFCGAIVKSNAFSFLAPWAALSIMVFVLGLISVAFANRYRIKVSLKVEAKEAAKNEEVQVCLNDQINELSEISHRLQVGAIVCFFIGCLIFATSIFLKV